MNQQLLQLALKFRPDEIGFHDRWMKGERPLWDQPFVRADEHLKQGKQVAIFQHMRFLHHLEYTCDFVELAYAYAGQSTHLINRNEVTLQTGELMLINQHTTRENLPLGENDISVSFIVLPVFFETTLKMMGNSDSILRQFLLSCLHDKNQVGGYLHFKVADILPVQAMLESMIWSLVHDMQYSRSINQYAMGLLFMYLLNHTDKAHSGSKQDELIFRVLQYIDENFAEGSLMELAAHLGYNMTWLSRSIRQLTGKSFIQLQQKRRVDQAKFLLETTQLPVLEIAKQVGYSNSSHFYEIFQKHADCSPSKYR